MQAPWIDTHGLGAYYFQASLEYGRVQCRDGGMVDAPDLKSVVREGVRVRVPLSAPARCVKGRAARRGYVAQLVRAHDS